jgi:uncharacterized phage protein (TIGR02218 family)
MTSRPGNLAVDALRFTRHKHVAQLLEIERQDGEFLRCTDHDRPLTFEGQTFRPIVMGSLSADRREAGLRSGSQEARGLIDGTYVTIDDLEGNRYLGAQVRQILVDWRRPWVALASHRRWIRSIVRTGSTWTASLEGRTQGLQRPQAGRFGGTFRPKCPYRLGGEFCRKDISEWTQIDAPETGTTSSATNLTMTVVGAGWTVDEWEGYTVLLHGGPTYVGSGQERVIASNTSDTITLIEPWDTIPSATPFKIGRGPYVDVVVRSRYEFEFDATYFTGTFEDGWYRDGTVEWTTGDNAGSIHAIADYIEASRRIVLLIPTQNDVQVGDRAIVRVGCDGLIGTCRDKFDNVVNFGGDPFAPSAQQIIEPPEAS